MRSYTPKKQISFLEAVLVSLILLITFSALTFLIPDAQLKLVISDILLPSTAFLAAISLFYASKFSKPYSKRIYNAWALLAAGYLFNALGGLVWFILEILLNYQPFPSLADFFYLMYYPLFLLGIYYLPTRKFERNERISLILDIGIVLLAALILFWNFLIGPTLELSIGEPIIMLVLSIIYPLFDLMLLFALLMLIFQDYEIKNQWPLLFLIISALATILTNSIFVYQSLLGIYVSGGPLDMGWMVAFVMAGLAGVLQANFMIKNSNENHDDLNSDLDEDIAEYPSKRKKNYLTLYLPYLWVFIAYLLLIWSYFYKIYINHSYLILVVLVIIILAIIRQIFTLNENEWLYDQLKDAYDKQEIKVQERTADLAEANKNLQKEIIERKKAEKELRLKAKLLDAATDSIYMHDFDGNFLYVNESAYKSSGYTHDELMSMNLHDLDIPEYSELIEPRIKKLLEKGESTFESANYNKDGTIKPVEVHAQIIKWDKKGLIISVARDITERKRAENELKKYQEHLEELVEQRTVDLKKVNKQLLSEIEERKQIQSALKESELIYRAIFENTGTSTMIIEEDTLISLINTESERLTGYSKEEIEGKRRWTEFIFADDLDAMLEYHKNRRIIPGSVPKTYETRCIFKDGKIRNIIVTVDMIPGTKRSVASFLDITERKKAEIQIKKSLNEKEVLLREIHHRVNNNMQIISSLLNLQSFHIKDENALNVFRESQNRVKSMAMIHEKLYQSKDIASIDFADYTSSLVSGIFSSYEIDTNHIKLKIDAQQILMGIDTAIPCGLIINELVTNSIKHAFVGRENGELDITLQRLSDDDYQLIIKDDGIGFPENIDFENVDTVGLQLVNGLVDQIDGTMELDASEGTQFSITFKEVRYLDRM